MADHIVKWKVEIDTAEAEAKLEQLVLLAERVEKARAAGEPPEPDTATATVTPRGIVEFTCPMTERMAGIRAAKDVMGEVIGKSIWDHTQAAQLEREGVVLVKVTGQLVAQMSDDWSAAQVKLVKNDDGTYEMRTRYIEAS